MKRNAKNEIQKSKGFTSLEPKSGTISQNVPGGKISTNWTKPWNNPGQTQPTFSFCHIEQYTAPDRIVMSLRTKCRLLGSPTEYGRQLVRWFHNRVNLIGLFRWWKRETPLKIWMRETRIGRDHGSRSRAFKKQLSHRAESKREVIMRQCSGPRRTSYQVLLRKYTAFQAFQVKNRIPTINAESWVEGQLYFKSPNGHQPLQCKSDFPDAEDEAIVNTYAILLLEQTSRLLKYVLAEWTMDRIKLEVWFNSKKYSAYTDGGLRPREVALFKLQLRWKGAFEYQTL